MLTGKTPFQGESLNDRFLKHSIPPREIDPTISPQLQEAIYRALERDPKNGYANFYEFALDFRRPKASGIAERSDLRYSKKQSAQPWRKVLPFVAIALVPVVIFGFLFYFVRH